MTIVMIISCTGINTVFESKMRPPGHEEPDISVNNGLLNLLATKIVCPFFHFHFAID